MPDAAVVARWKAIGSNLVKAHKGEPHTSATGTVVRSEDGLLTLRTETGAEVVVRQDWIDREAP